MLYILADDRVLPHHGAGGVSEAGLHARAHAAVQNDQELVILAQVDEEVWWAAHDDEEVGDDGEHVHRDARLHEGLDVLALEVELSTNFRKDFTTTISQPKKREVG